MKRYKVQGARYKVQGARFSLFLVPCTLDLFYL